MRVCRPPRLLSGRWKHKTRERFYPTCLLTGLFGRVTVRLFGGSTGRLCGFFYEERSAFSAPRSFFRLASSCNVCERSRDGEYMPVKVSKIYKKTCERVQKPPHNLTFRKKNSIIGKTDCSTDCKSSRTAKQVARRPYRIFTLGEFSPTLFFRQRSRDRRVFGGD